VVPAAASTPPAATRPAVLVIGQRSAAVRGSDPLATGKPAAAPLKLLAALLESLTRPRDGEVSPLLALGPTSMQGLLTNNGPAGVPAQTPGQLELDPLSIPGAGTSQWDDTAAAGIDTLERKLALQIEQHRSSSVIAGTRFALARAIWDNSDAPSAQSRALTLANESKAALAAIPVYNLSPGVKELRESVDDWLNVHARRVQDGPGPQQQP